MIELIYHKGSMQLPENFEECSGKQFIKLSNLVFTGGDELRCEMKALKVLCGFSAFRFTLLTLLKPHVVNNALQYVKWVFDKEKNVTKQLLPFYKGRYGPASNFDNLRMKEFHMSELYYREMANEENEDVEASLNNLVAVLYRKPRWFYNKKKDKHGDIRREFNHNTLPYHARKIKRWPLKVKQAVFLWYAGCRQELEDNNPLVFKEGGDFQSQFDTGLYGVMRNLAGDKLGKVEEIEKMYVHTAMLEIGLIKEEEKYFDEKLKQKTA